MKKIAVDIMGFENSNFEAIKACNDFLQKNKEIGITLVGDEQIINQFFKIHKKHPNIDWIYSTQTIRMDEQILHARKKTNSSMQLAIDLVKNDKAHAVLSAGNSGVYGFLTQLNFNKLSCIQQIGFMPYVPRFETKGFNFLDVGANLNSTEKDIVNYAVLGSLFVNKIRNVTHPKVALLNIGTEDNKGFEYQIKANQFLKKNTNSFFKYIGFIEPKNILESDIDLLLADGYSGNLVLKSLEGNFKYIFSLLKKWYKTPLIGQISALFSRPFLVKVKKNFDYRNNAGAVLLGLEKIAIKTHGSADYLQFYSSLRLAKEMLDKDLINELKKSLEWYGK